MRWIPDATIAASALTSQAAAVTRNTNDFHERVAGLTVIHPDKQYTLHSSVCQQTTAG
jgi:predicted nucleic acid-binding protein